MKTVPHQSRSCASRQFAHKLKQLHKVCVIDPKPQEVTTHSTGNMTQIPLGEREITALISE